MKVVLVPRDIDGSGCYRVLLPARELRLQRGWDAHMAPHGITNFAAGRGVNQQTATRRFTFLELPEFIDETACDAVWWQPRPEPWVAPAMLGFKLRGKRMLVDVDDAWWGLPDWNPARERDPRLIEAMRNQLRAADGVSVATPALAELYRPYNPNIRVIRNRLDLHMWEDVTPAYEVERKRVRIGWMGDSTWRAGDLRVLAPWLGRWLRDHPEVEFVAAGDPRVHDLLDVPAGQRVSTNVVEFYNFDLADITATFDIGLVPLAMDTPEARRLNECKSHLKGLEYNAAGIPFVATETESYRWWRGQNETDAETCILAASPEQWIEALDEMIDDRNWARNWRRMGHAARAVASRHTLQTNISEWEAWIAGSSHNAEHPRTRAPATGSMAVR